MSEELPPEIEHALADMIERAALQMEADQQHLDLRCRVMEAMGWIWWIVPDDDELGVPAHSLLMPPNVKIPTNGPKLVRGKLSQLDDRLGTILPKLHRDFNSLKQVEDQLVQDHNLPQWGSYLCAVTGEKSAFRALRKATCLQRLEVLLKTINRWNIVQHEDN